MIRIVIENILLFLLPTFLYVGWVMVQRARDQDRDDDQRPWAVDGVLDDAPFVWLFMIGAALVLLILAIFGTTSGGKPGQHYQPSIMKDGKIQPGSID